jgi:hypothetical protein
MSLAGGAGEEKIMLAEAGVALIARKVTGRATRSALPEAPVIGVGRLAGRGREESGARG